MLETDSHTMHAGARRRLAERGSVAVEFALVASIFFMLLFGILEIARIMYMYNTLSDVTRTAARAAANIDWRDTAALDLVRQQAIFRNNPGELPFGAPVTDRNIRFDYLTVNQTGTTVTLNPVTNSMPACPGRNHLNCLRNGYVTATTTSANACIRLVQARICQAGGNACTQLDYQMLFPILNLQVRLPLSTTIVPAGSLGYSPGGPVCLQ